MLIGFICLITLLVILIILNQNKKDQINELVSTKYKLDKEIRKLNAELNKANNNIQKYQVEISDLKEKSKKLKEKKMSPAQIKEKRAEKQRAENYKLWSQEITRNLRTGTTKFVWRSMEDGRVCQECRKLDGKEFTKSDLSRLRRLYKKHEGEFGCRCYLEPEN